MKKVVFINYYSLFITCFCVISLGFSQSIFTNNIDGSGPNQPSRFDPFTNGQVVDANISVSGIGRGSGITAINANDRYDARGWNSSSLDVDDYYEFIITPISTSQIDFINFIYTSERDHSSLSNFAFRSSVDGFTSDIGVPTFDGTTIDLSSATYQNITTAITFRFYAWGANNINRDFSINDFTFNGSVSCPTTTTWNGAAWDFGTPNNGANVVINGDYNTSVSSIGSFSSCSLTVNSGFRLTVDNNTFVNVNKDVIVDGELFVESQGSFVQNSDDGSFTLNIGLAIP